MKNMPLPNLLSKKFMLRSDILDLDFSQNLDDCKNRQVDWENDEETDSAGVTLYLIHSHIVKAEGCADEDHSTRH